MLNKTIPSEKSVEGTCPKHRLVTGGSADGPAAAVPGCELAPLAPSGAYTDPFRAPTPTPPPPSA